LKNDLLPLHLGRAQELNGQYEEIAIFTFIRQKTLYMGNLMKYRAGAITVALNISGPLDLARADPMAAIRSQYRIGKGYGVGGFYIHMTCNIAIAISHRRSHIGGGMGEGLYTTVMSDERNGAMRYIVDR